ncbi:MAG: AhpC/TSA family protein [Bacteroidales bacterium]|jgi:peroxiredoxin|nr:AhpC/TSA family protein [Bacteroidales bacterium]
MKLFGCFGIAFLSLLLINGCEKNSQFTVNGRISHAEGKTIYLEELLLNSTKHVDSVKINKNGEYELKGFTTVPAFYLLKLNDLKFITVLIDSAENVTVNADFTNFSNDYFIDGSHGSALVKELNLRLASTRHKLDSLNSLNNLYLNNPDYEQQKKLWETEYQQVLQDQIEYSKQFVTNNPFSMASIIALFQKFDDQNFIINDLQTMRTAASALNSIYPQSEHVKVLYAHTLEYLKSQSNANARQLIQEHGANSPDITLPDINGNLISLSSLRGKVVLLQFWASVDQGSRTMNPVLVEAYEKYKSKGFEIYQVSLDNNRIEWVDAIDKDELSWINVGDMEGSTLAVSHYNIQEIPYNYLLNTDGTIVAQNLNGPALDRTLSHILK